MNDFVVSLNSYKKELSLSEDSTVFYNGKRYDYELIELSSSNYLLRIENRFHEISFRKTGGENISVSIGGREFETLVRTALQEKANKLIERKTASRQITKVKAPMPGMILKINKKPGDKVQQSDSVMILEAMKMENDLRAPVSGVVKEIFGQEGSPVEKGTNLFSIE